MSLPTLRLKKNEDRRLKAGHLWIYSNEIDTQFSPLKSFTAGQEVRIESADKLKMGVGYINPNSLITARITSRKPSDRLDAALLQQRLQSALEWRETVFTKPFYRLVFSESDGLPGLIVDRYGPHLAVQLNTAGMDAKKDIIVQALRDLLPATESILLRNDSATRLTEGLDTVIETAFGTPPEVITVEENGVVFNAPFLKGQKTGWFYDHRLNRSRLKDYVSGKTVLDVFSYLGAWGIQAAVNGAKHVTCIDSSQLAVDFIEQNAALNGVEHTVTALCVDAFDGLKKLLQEQKTFDVIILDPPAFIKKLKDKKEGTIAYQRINEMALRLLNPNGLLLSCSCSMQLDASELSQIVRKAAIAVKADIHLVERGHQAQDHPVHLAIPETDYLKMVMVRKK